MKHIFFKLLPPRSSFIHDMSEVEAQLMNQHAAYWKSLLDTGHIHAYSLGVVADPTGVYGAGIIALTDEVDAESLIRDDPTIQSNLGFQFELHPMPRAVIRT